MVVTNHSTGDECRVKFEPFSYFGGTPKKVAGRVVGKKGKVEYVVEGTWDAKVQYMQLTNDKRFFTGFGVETSWKYQKFWIFRAEIEYLSRN